MRASNARFVVVAAVAVADPTQLAAKLISRGKVNRLC